MRVQPDSSDERHQCLGALAQPTITSVTGCNAGSTSYTFYLVAKNAGGASPPSAGFTVNSVSNTAPLGCTLNYSAVPNATAYDGLVDGFVIAGTSTTTTMGVNIGLGPTRGMVADGSDCDHANRYQHEYDDSVTTNSKCCGINIHNLRMDSSGQWIQMTTSNAFAKSQHSPAKLRSDSLEISGLATYPLRPWNADRSLFVELRGSLDAS